MTRLREGAVVRPLELFSKIKRSVASIFKTTGDVAGALRHAPAYSITFTGILIVDKGKEPNLRGVPQLG